jgi:hypothetical protein
VTGGLLGALLDLGVPKETAEYYAEGVRRGGHLVTLNTPSDMTQRAVDILNRHNPVDVNERAETWRQAGWSGFDPNAGAYTPTSYQTTETTARDWPRSTGEMSDVTPGRMSSTTTSGYNDFSYYDTDFRHHFETSALSNDYTYDQFRPAYRYGYDLATDDRYRGRDWDEIEMDVRSRWDERNPGTWERFKTSVRHAWEEIKDTVS